MQGHQHLVVMNPWDEDLYEPAGRVTRKWLPGPEGCVQLGSMLLDQKILRRCLLGRLVVKLCYLQR